MRVGIDIDGVLADFNAAYIQRCIDITGKDLFPVRPFDITTWNYPESYGYTKDEVSAVWKSIKEDGGFWEGLSQYPDAQTIRRIVDTENDVYFITSRPGDTAKYQTEDWLMVLGINTPTVLISSEKGECAHALNLTHYLDDRWENCADVFMESPETKCYMLARTWNHEVEGVTRVSSLQNFVDDVLGVAEVLDPKAREEFWRDIDPGDEA